MSHGWTLVIPETARIGEVTMLVPENLEERGETVHHRDYNPCGG